MTTKTKPTVLILIQHFLPGYKMGGPLTSIINMVENMSDYFDFKILTSDRDMGDSEPYKEVQINSWIDKGIYKIYYIKSGILKLYSMLKLINSSNADVLYINSLLSPTYSIFIILMNKLGLLKIKIIVLSPRGETYDEALNFKKGKKRLYFKLALIFKLYKNIHWQASSDVEKTFIIKNLKIKPEMVNVAQNLTQKINNAVMPESSEINDDDILRIVFLSRISKDKNITFTFDILNEIKSNVVFDIYGPIEDEYIWDICRKKMAALPGNIHVEYKGSVAKDKVKEIFFGYDLMFLPTFAENFGHVIVESLSVGTPVLISDNTPWKNLTAQGFGWDINLNDSQAFVKAIEEIATLPTEKRMENKKIRSRNFINLLNNPEILEANKNVFLIPINQNYGKY